MVSGRRSRDSLFVLISRLYRTQHPGREKFPRQKSSRPSVFDTATPPSVTRARAMSESLAHILLILLERDGKNAAMIHGTFDVYNFAKLCSEGVSLRNGSYVAVAMFFNTFASCHPFPDIPFPRRLIRKLPEMVAAYPAAHAFVRYLFTSPQERYQDNLSAVVDHIVRAIGPFATRTPQQEVTKIVMRMHPYLKEPSVTHPIWPFLCFAVLITWQSADATRMLIDANILRMVEELHRRYNDTPMRLLYLALFTTMSQHRDLSDCRLKHSLENWALRRQQRAATDSSIQRTTSVGSHSSLSRGRQHSVSVGSRAAPAVLDMSHLSRAQNTSVGSVGFPEPSAAAGMVNPVSTFPADQRLDVDTTPRGTCSPSHPLSASFCGSSHESNASTDLRSPYFGQLMAEALAFAQQAVDFDSKNRVTHAVAAYTKSVELLVGGIKLKAQERRVSRTALRMRDLVRMPLEYCKSCVLTSFVLGLSNLVRLVSRTD